MLSCIYRLWLTCNKNSFPNISKLFSIKVLICSQFTHKIYNIIRQIIFGYFDLYLLLFITTKSDMKTAQKIVNNLINENIFLLKVSLLRQDG